MRLRSRVIRNLERSRVLVELKSGEAFTGILFDFDGQAFVLRNVEAVAYNEDKTNAVVDGELIILRPDVAYLQKPKS